MQAFYDNRTRSPSPNKMPLEIAVGTITLGEAPSQRQRSRSRPTDLRPIQEISDDEGDMDPDSEHGLRTAAQVANRGRCQTSGSGTPGSDSEEASLPSENETVKLVEAMDAAAWRKEWMMEDDAEFAFAFANIEVA